MTVTIAEKMWNDLETESPRWDKHLLFRYQRSLTCECPSSITILRNFNELNRIHWQSPTWGSSEWTKLPGLNHCQNVWCPNLAKKESSPPSYKCLVTPRHTWNGLPITRFRKHRSLTPSLQSKYWGLGCSSVVEFLPSMQKAWALSPTLQKGNSAIVNVSGSQ